MKTRNLSTKQLEAKIQESIENQTVFVCKGVNDVNHNPHPYMIGPAHVAYASDNHGGMLGEETLQKIKCAHPGCNMSYDDHTSDRVAFMQLLRHASNMEVDVIVKKMIKEIPESELDGLVFVETPEEFRISETVQVTDVKKLQKAYNKALKNDAESFMYNGAELVTNYAKYLLEYLNNQKK